MLALVIAVIFNAYQCISCYCITVTVVVVVVVVIVAAAIAKKCPLVAENVVNHLSPTTSG